MNNFQQRHATNELRVKIKTHFSMETDRSWTKLKVIIRWLLETNFSISSTRKFHCDLYIASFTSSSQCFKLILFILLSRWWTKFSSNSKQVSDCDDHGRLTYLFFQSTTSWLLKISRWTDNFLCESISGMNDDILICEIELTASWLLEIVSGLKYTTVDRLAQW